MNLAIFFLALEDYMLPCITKILLGFDCPGCGMQRSVILLLQGNFTEAFYMYPAIFGMIPLFGFLLADSFFTIKYSKFITLSLLTATMILLLGNYILKFI